MTIHNAQEALAAVERVAEGAVRKPVTATEMVAWLRELDQLIRDHRSAL